MQSIYCSAELYMEGEPLFNDALKKMQSGEFSLSPSSVISYISGEFFGQVHELIYYIIMFFCIGAVGAVINLMNDSFKMRTGEMSFFACYALCAAAAVKCYTVCLEYAIDVIGRMTDFITKLAPMITTLVITSGKPVSAGAFHPVLMSAVYVVSIVCSECIVPLASYSAVLSVANNISAQVQIGGVCRLISSCAKWILALSFTLFTGICGIYGFSAPALDAVSARTVKFAVGSLIPVVGSFLSDTLETVAVGSQMMKNTVGGAGLAVLCVICAVPMIKIGAMALIVRISSAVVEPVSDSRISRLLSDISGAVTILFAMVVTVAVLFMICISIILAATA